MIILLTIQVVFIWVVCIGLITTVLLLRFSRNKVERPVKKHEATKIEIDELMEVIEQETNHK